MASGNGFDPYRTLGLERGATAEQVAQAYRVGAKGSHPDLHGPGAERRMQELNRAFQLLSDPVLRAAWDADHPLSGPPVAHWEHHRRAVGVPPSSGAPASWSGWEVDRSGPTAGEMRVRAASGWPRATRQPAPAARGLRESAWLAVGVAGVLVVVLLFLGWVASTPRLPGSPQQAIAGLGLTAASDLALDPNHQLAVVRDPAGLLLLVAAERIGDGGWEASILAQAGTTHPISVILYQESDAPIGAFASVAFGLAEGGVARVRLPGIDGRGGDVTNGTWAVALPTRVDPAELDWEFLSPDGSVIVRGSGELNLP